MKLNVRSQVEVHVCFEDEGSPNVTAFDVCHRWSLPECRPGILCGEETLIRMESCLALDEDFTQMWGFNLRWQPGCKTVRFGTGKRKRSIRFPVTYSGNGGNIFWQIIGFPRKRVPHVLNWLRRQKHFSPSEWLDDFLPVWRSRRALDVAALRRVTSKLIFSDLKGQARRCECSLEKLIELSS